MPAEQSAAAGADRRWPDTQRRARGIRLRRNLQPLTALYRDISSNYREVLTEEVSHDVVRMRQRRG
jgi:hypothetical protein